MSAELTLINKVELRLALTANDKEFETALKTYLAPVLLKLASPAADVRQAVFKILQQLIPRIQSSKAVKLPVLALIEEAQNPKVPEGSDASNVRLYSLLLASKGIDRLDESERRDLIPIIINGISQTPYAAQARLFGILCTILETAPSAVESVKSSMGRPDQQFLSQCISRFFLLEPFTGQPIPLPGLSVRETSFLTKDAGKVFQTNSELSLTKSTLLSFLRCNFSDEYLRIPYLIASVDGSSAVRDSSEILYRKLKLDLEDAEFINDTIALFVGNQDTPSVGPILQDKIIQLLSKSTIAMKHEKLPEICKLGLNSDYLRLKQLTVLFVKWLSRSGSDHAAMASSHLESFHCDVILQLREGIIMDGWPRLDPKKVKNYASSSKLRALQYEAIGNILRANPNLFLDDISYVDFLFKSLEGENSELRSTIQEALSSLTSHLPALSKSAKLKLKAICRRYMDAEPVDTSIHSCRYIGIKYINCAFPFNDSDARFICLMGTSKDNLPDTHEEARKGLHPYWFNIMQSSHVAEIKNSAENATLENAMEFPSFAEFVCLIATEVAKGANNLLSLISSWLPQAIEFSFQILVMSALRGEQTVIVPDQEWHVRLEKSVYTDDKVHSLLIREVDRMVEEEGHSTGNPINQLLSIIFDGMLQQYSSKGTPHNRIYGDVLTQLLKVSPLLVITPLIPGTAGLLDIILSKKIRGDKLHTQMNQILGVIATHPAHENLAVLALLRSLVVNDTEASSSKERMLASSYVLSRLTLRKRDDIITGEYLEDFCQKLTLFISDPQCYSWVLECLEQLSVSGLLGPTLNLSLQPTVQQFLKLIAPKVKKCDEDSTAAYCLLTLALAKSPNESSSMAAHEDLIFQTHISKQAEFTFTSGEGFLVLAAGWQSKYLQRKLDIRGVDMSHLPSDVSRLSDVLSKVLSACANTKPSLRKAACIWLLSMVQFCGHLQEVAKRSAEIQMAFMRFLASRDELVQESASRGLSLVYEAGNKELKDTLVRGLLKSFTDTNSATKLTSGSVDEETELFDQDVLKTHDGSVSTYKDVLSLASEVGDASLVYKFMSLAKSSTLWSSRKGIAFGLSSILSKSSLDELLSTNQSLARKLIPKLYRYRYDPNSSVQRSMNDIWNALVKDPAHTIRTNFQIILEELLTNMGDREWRVRQASTAALNDLLQTTPIEVYENRVQEIWKMSFRAMDDVKESVRREGGKLTKSLANSLLKLVDCTEGGSVAKAAETLNTLIPFLLGINGLLSDSDDVKAFALRTLMKACKVGGDAVVKLIPTLVENFILLVSSLENEAVNYLIMNADKYDLTDSEIDAKRLQGLGHSPLMEAAEKLVKSLNESVMPEFMLKLESAIRSSIGLPSKVAGSRVIILLITNHYELCKPYGTKLLQISIYQLRDKNITIASAYATAAGYACRLASIDSVVAYSKQVESLYFEGTTEKSRTLAAVASEAVSKYAGDAFQDVLSAFLPLAFIGKYDACESVKSPFAREWIENTSSDTSINIYLDEILRYFQTYQTSNSFEIRKVLARSICQVAQSVGDELLLSTSFKHAILDVLIKASKGRSWDGKEFVFEALVLFAIKLKSFIKLDNSLEGSISRIAICEAKRKNKLYQKVALPLLGRYIHEFSGAGLMDAYVEEMSAILSDSYYKANEDDSSDEEDDGDNGMKLGAKSRISNNRNIELEEQRLEQVKNLQLALNPSLSQSQHELLVFTLNAYYNMFHLNMIQNTWRSQLVICESLDVLIKKIIGVPQISQDIVELTMKTWKQLHATCVSPTSIENVKVQFVRTSGRLISFLSYCGHGKDVTLVVQALKDMETEDVSSVVKTEVGNALTTSASFMS